MPNNLQELSPQMLSMLRVLQAKGGSQLDKVTAHELGVRPSQLSKMRRYAKEAGLIINESAVILSAKELGFQIAFFEVKFKNQGAHQAAEELWATWPEVQEIHILLPHHTTFLKVRVRSNVDLHEFKMKLWGTEGMEKVDEKVGVTVKETFSLPI